MRKLLETLKDYCNPMDGRYEDLAHGTWYVNVFRDITAGLMVAMLAIPLAMGFAIASGLRPEMGIVGGALAGAVGALLGGSKYQVYGPTAAFIPILSALMASYDHAFLVLASMIAGVILIGLGLARLGRIVALIPHSIVVGFTLGIAIVIAMSQLGEVLGLPDKLPSSLVGKVMGVAEQAGLINLYAVVLAVLTFVILKAMLKLSVYIPAPLIALAVAVALSSYVWPDQGLLLVKDYRYNELPTDWLRFTSPLLPELSPQVAFDLAYFVAAIVLVSAIESFHCSRLADRLAANEVTPCNPDKELWGQGWVQIIVPLLNGFPHTGARARTAANIKLGALSPLAGIFKGVFKLGLAFYLATFLGNVPMACIAGLLLYVASGMVKTSDVKQVLHHNKFHIALMIWTAVLVIATDFLLGVLSAILLYGALYKFFDSVPESTLSERLRIGQKTGEPVASKAEVS